MELTDKLSDGYKSEGERQIAALLDRYGIPFLYEKETLVEDNFKLKIWYPDFYLPDFKVYVEYFGLQNDAGYRERTAHKMQVYAENKLDLVPVFPENLRQLEPYLLGGIERILKGRVAAFERIVQPRTLVPEVQSSYRAPGPSDGANGIEGRLNRGL